MIFYKTRNAKEDLLDVLIVCLYSEFNQEDREQEDEAIVQCRLAGHR